jgi:hypothetical protein
VCGRRYESRNVDILGQQGGLWFASVFCPFCHTHGLVAAVLSEESTEDITDLSEEEYAKFAGSEAIGFDDVLDMHNFLKGCDGDISKLPCNG